MNPFSQLMLSCAFLAGLATALAGASLYDRWFDDPAVAREAHEAGERAERRFWEEARRKAEALSAQRLAEAQAEINAADQVLQEYRASGRRRAEAIRRAYEERMNNESPDLEPGCDLSKCPVPAWVRKELE